MLVHAGDVLLHCYFSFCDPRTTMHIFFFFFNDTATTEIYTLSLHDALPISAPRAQEEDEEGLTMSVIRGVLSWFRDAFGPGPRTADGRRSGGSMDIKRDRMVFLGYGKYWRSDAIIGLMPIEEERGPKRRTNVFVQGRAEPI